MENTNMKEMCASKVSKRLAHAGRMSHSMFNFTTRIACVGYTHNGVTASERETRGDETLPYIRTFFMRRKNLFIPDIVLQYNVRLASRNGDIYEISILSLCSSVQLLRVSVLDNWKRFLQIHGETQVFRKQGTTFIFRHFITENVCSHSKCY
jgi:hypothetical protein